MSQVPVRFRTNLDLHHSEEWPERLLGRPVVGDLVQSRTSRRGVKLELEIKRVTWKTLDGEEYAFVEAELGLVTTRFKSITDFQEWYQGLLRC